MRVHFAVLSTVVVLGVLGVLRLKLRVNLLRVSDILRNCNRLLLDCNGLLLICLKLRVGLLLIDCKRLLLIWLWGELLLLWW